MVRQPGKKPVTALEAKVHPREFEYNEVLDQYGFESDSIWGVTDSKGKARGVITPIRINYARQKNRCYLETESQVSVLLVGV